MSRHARRPLRVHRSLLARIALTFAGAVAVTALALSLSAYFIIRTAQEKDALDKALAQTRLNFLLADSMLPERPRAEDYEHLVDAFKIRGDFGTLILAGGTAYVSGPDVTPALITPELAAKVAQGRIGYQTILMAGNPTLVVGGQVRAAELVFYFFYPQAQRLADLARLRNILIVTAVVLAVLGALAGYLLARGLVRPLREVSSAAVRMSKGNLDIRLSEGPDEFGVLVSSFNRMAENLQAKMRDLEAGQARERRFVADVTHELRTPLSALVGEASLLKSKLEADPQLCPADVRRLVSLINNDITRLRQLVDDLLEISRLDARAAETVLEPVDLPLFLDRLVRAHEWSDRIQVPRAGDVLYGASREAEAQRPVAWADRRRLERILVNLLENALQHGAPPVTAEVYWARGTGAETPRMVKISVQDRGPGIPAEHLPHIFDRFYKADPSRSSSRGSGLGLAIARENARLMGGDLRAENVPGGGALFILSLPAAPPSDPRNQR